MASALFPVRPAVDKCIIRSCDDLARNGNGIEVAARDRDCQQFCDIRSERWGGCLGRAILNVDTTVLLNNSVGANASVGGATIALHNFSLHANNTAVLGAAGANFVSAQNNEFSGNGNNGALPSASNDNPLIFGVQARRSFGCSFKDHLSTWSPAGDGGAFLKSQRLAFELERVAQASP